ncbi:alkaline phosphatase [Escherichia coli]|uniref:Alkaline phosphatase n=1 Tax=Escherichia coli TaxID=562 RepID=A0A2X3KG83_ECOLX|nr:alkaline phosphatase [Escherichia coli]
MKQSTIALALLTLLFTPVTKARTPEMPVLENRAAQGDITAPGGARRLTVIIPPLCVILLAINLQKILFC